jgi:seryl-tRNA synthetase
VLSARDNRQPIRARMRRPLAPARALRHKRRVHRRGPHNAASKQVGAAKAKGDEAEFERLRALVAEKKDEIARLEDEAKEGQGRGADRDLLMGLPNLPYDDVARRRGRGRQCRDPPLGHPREFDFTPKEHFELEASGRAWISRPPPSSPAPASC